MGFTAINARAVAPTPCSYSSTDDNARLGVNSAGIGKAFLALATRPNASPSVTNPYGLASPTSSPFRQDFAGVEVQASSQRQSWTKPGPPTQAIRTVHSTAKKTNVFRPTTGKRKRTSDGSLVTTSAKLAKVIEEPSKKQLEDLDTSCEFHWRQVSSGVSFVQVTGIILPKSKLAVSERKPPQASRQERAASLLGQCDCPDCAPDLYNDTDSTTTCTPKSPWLDNDVMNIARSIVRDIKTRKGVPGGWWRWYRWNEKFANIGFGRKVVEALSDLSEITNIFNALFFNGRISSERLITRWAELDPNTLGWTRSDIYPDRKVIELNSDLAQMKLSRQCVIETLLHEMVHAYVDSYAPNPRLWNTCHDSHSCRRLYRTNIGPCSHGRAWQLVAKAIEDTSEAVLGFRCEIGRADALQDRLDDGASIPCGRDAQRLYPWLIGTPHLQCRDDDRVCFLRTAYRDRRVLDWAPWTIYRDHKRRRKSI